MAKRESGVVEVTGRGLVHAFVELAQSVNEAFSQAPELPLTPENERERHASALAFVARFFGQFNAPFADRFFELGLAIADLNAGILPPLLIRSHVKGKREGRPFDSSQLSCACSCGPRPSCVFALGRAIGIRCLKASAQPQASCSDSSEQTSQTRVSSW